MKIESTLTDRAGDTFRVVFKDGDPMEGVEQVFFQGVRAFCFCEGKLVIVYADNKKYWLPPGGGIEPGENYEQAIRREIKEETNMEVLYHELIGYQDVYEPNRISRQTRSFCIVKPFSNFVADPDGDVTEIKLIDPTEYKKYFDWTAIGDYLMQESLRRLHKVLLVDENDNIIGSKYREEIDSSKDTHRCSGVWITNSKGEVLIAQRKLTKKQDPGKWGPAVAGTVEIGETYESNAYKETQEEIGLSGIELKLGPKYHSTSPTKFFGQWFLCTVDKPAEAFTLQEEEVEQLMWIDAKRLLADIKNNPAKYVPSLPKVIGLLIES